MAGYRVLADFVSVTLAAMYVAVALAGLGVGLAVINVAIARHKSAHVDTVDRLARATWPGPRLTVNTGCGKSLPKTSLLVVLLFSRSIQWR